LIVIACLIIPQSSNLFAEKQPSLKVKNELVWRVTKLASSAFTGAGSAHGDKDAANTYTIFTVTGVIATRGIFGVVNTTLVGVSGDISLGIVGDTTAFVSADDAPTWAGGDILGDFNFGSADLSDNALMSPITALGELLIIDGSDIQELTATADITGGQIDYFIIWAPMEPGASIVAAGTLSQV
ncbi:hypothetical protein LCGC14_0945650, partial [marine sediment metagenome]